LTRPNEPGRHKSGGTDEPRGREQQKLMGRKSKSQWDFGELFPPASRPAEQPGDDAASTEGPTRKIFSVSELTLQVRQMLEKQIGQVWVTGEATNLRAQSSGHIYFTLKDASAQLNCVLFRRETVAHRELLQDGQKLLLQGDLTVYEARGQYQLIVRAIELQGVGALQIAFEKLKQKLQAEGLFAPERKRLLPEFPQGLGLVTSPTGAAIRDVLHVVRRRHPGLEIILTPCRVQGEGAAAEIAAAIGLLNQFKMQNAKCKMDLILITRGGGSLEDLWAFNEEIVARAIFESALPVVSAVGHEIDFTISDFVADLRAATPSAAAEIITESVFASREFVAGAPARLRQWAGRQLDDKLAGLAQLDERRARVHPRRRLNDWLQRLDDLQAGLLRSVRQEARRQSVAWRNLFERLARLRPSQWLQQRRERIERETRRLRERTRFQMQQHRDQLATLEARLRLLGPDQVLARGYSITTDADTGKVMRDAAEVRGGQRLKTRLKTGELFSRVEGDAAP
jgi:exodeoxyribonuclease VII large subunit